MTDYERIGGETGLRAIVEDFIGRVYGDLIIGFFFARIDKEQLIAHECAFAASHLGGPAQYEGRPLPAAHRPHPINSGHFHRRIWLLENTLRDHDVPDDVVTHWLDHNRRLERSIVSAGDCV